jgi:signal transduction histidine kinase
MSTAELAKARELALAISRELARAMHGELTVESTVGSRVTVRLPRALKPGGRT